MKTVLLAAILASLILVVGAQAKVTDPRKCDRGTPGDPSHHSYWCAKWAAVDTVRQVMVRRQKVERWYPGVFCDENGSLLNWSCVTILGGDQWKVSVRWRALSSGWHVYTSVTAMP